MVRMVRLYRILPFLKITFCGIFNHLKQQPPDLLSLQTQKFSTEFSLTWSLSAHSFGFINLSLIPFPSVNELTHAPP